MYVLLGKYQVEIMAKTGPGKYINFVFDRSTVRKLWRYFILTWVWEKWEKWDDQVKQCSQCEVHIHQRGGNMRRFDYLIFCVEQHTFCVRWEWDGVENTLFFASHSEIWSFPCKYLSLRLMPMLYIMRSNTENSAWFCISNYIMYMQKASGWEVPCMY